MNSALKRRTYVIQAFLTVLAVFWLYPITQSLIQSFRLDGIRNYINVLRNPQINYLKVLMNSLLISVCATLLVLILTAMGGYAFSKMTFRFKSVIYYSLLACLSLPPVAMLSPLFFTVKQMGLMNTYAAVILPVVAFQAPFILLLVKNYFDQIPGFPARSCRDRRSLLAPDPFHRHRSHRRAGADQRRGSDIHQFLERVLPSSDFPE